MHTHTALFTVWTVRHLQRFLQVWLWIQIPRSYTHPTPMTSDLTPLALLMCVDGFLCQSLHAVNKLQLLTCSALHIHFHARNGWRSLPSSALNLFSPQGFEDVVWGITRSWPTQQTLSSHGLSQRHAASQLNESPFSIWPRHLWEEMICSRLNDIYLFSAGVSFGEKSHYHVVNTGRSTLLCFLKVACTYPASHCLLLH